MGFRIQNNLAAMNAQRNLSTSDAGMSKSLERLSSGYRINSAKDDAAGLAISQGFRADIASVKVAQRNITEANALLQTAEGAMSSVGDILTRMKELATQAASANVGTNIDKVSDEYNTLVAEIDRIADSTKYAGTSLTDGTFSAGNTSTTWDAIGNVYNVAVTNAATGSYTVAYTANGGNVLSITKGTTTETAVLADAGGTAGSVNFSELGISFSYTGAMVADTLGAALDGPLPFAYPYQLCYGHFRGISHVTEIKILQHQPSPGSGPRHHPLQGDGFFQRGPTHGSGTGRGAVHARADPGPAYRQIQSPQGGTLYRSGHARGGGLSCG